MYFSAHCLKFNSVILISVQKIPQCTDIRITSLRTYTVFSYEIEAETYLLDRVNRPSE